MKPGHSRAQLLEKTAGVLRVSPEQIRQLQIVRRSIDARRKPQIFYVYTVRVRLADEAGFFRRRGKRPGNIARVTPAAYRFPPAGQEKLSERPVVIGTGPAGLFCGLLLARAGYAPLLLERGRAVDERVRDVERFWAGGPLDTESNIQFGEGGAGTFSDGKLNTMVKDPMLRGRTVLEAFVRAGAPEDILYVNKPHIGTDLLRVVIRNLRREIESLGGEFRFSSKVTDFLVRDGRLEALEINGRERIAAQAAVLAIGHSARDTFEVLRERGVQMRAKSFAVGFRVEHPQALINLSQYGQEYPAQLPAADYKLTHRCQNGRGVYTFCMCPGGQVVNSSSEEGMTVVNGMSRRARDGRNANSALIVTVTPEDYPGQDELAGVAFQRRLERAAWEAGGGRIPVQLFGDYRADRASTALGGITPDTGGGYVLTGLGEILPAPLRESLIEGMLAFDRKIPGFAREDALLLGVESRTSSPVKILRDERMESSIPGLYPCGEGPGYAGGIMSAAMDGCRAAEVIAARYAPFTKEATNNYGYQKTADPQKAGRD